MKLNLVYNVYLEDINAHEIKSYNIFEHEGFYNDLLKIKKQFKKDLKQFLKENGQYNILPKYQKWLTYYKINIFEKAVINSLQYYFWAKCEYEVVITSWPIYINVQEFNKIKESSTDPKYLFTIDTDLSKKIDVYDQVMLNRDLFINYVWTNLDLFKGKKSING